MSIPASKLHCKRFVSTNMYSDLRRLCSIVVGIPTLVCSMSITSSSTESTVTEKQCSYT